MRRIRYLVGETLTNIRCNRTPSLIALTTTAFTLACFGVFLLLYWNLRGLASSLQDEMKVIIYVKDDLSPQGITNLQQRLNHEPAVGSLAYISKEQARQEFREQFPSDFRLLEGLGENPLPASFVVTLAPSYQSSGTIKQWADRLTMIPGVAHVQYSRDWIENLSTVLGVVELAAITVGLILSAASVAIIAGTIRLTLYARRDEIEIMRMIGATGAFIKIPYLLEGALLGAIGGLLSLGFLKGGFEFFKYRLGTLEGFWGAKSSFVVFPARIFVMMVMIGLVLGSVGSFVSLVEIRRPKS